MKSFSFLLVPLLGLITGCTGTSNFSGPAYAHEVHPYVVTYDDQTARSLLGPEWILDNYQRVPPAYEGGEAELKRKDTSEYTADYAFDLDDDGTYEDKEELPRFDLLFKHRKTNAEIWLSTVPLSREYSDKELRLLVDNYVDAMSGSGAVVFKLGEGAGVEAKHYSARLLEQSEAKLSGFDALAATIEIANVDQLKLSPDARKEKVRVVLSRPNLWLVRERMPKPSVRYRVLMVVGYSNSPQDFEAQYPEFERFVGKIHVLSDEQALDLVGLTLQECKSGAASSTVVVKVYKNGDASLKKSANLDEFCANGVVGGRHFQRGSERELERTYDWSKAALPPSWLHESSYSESRPPSGDAPPAEVASEPEQPGESGESGEGETAP